MSVLLPYGVTLYSMIDAYIKLTTLPIYMESANTNIQRTFSRRKDNHYATCTALINTSRLEQGQRLSINIKSLTIKKPI
jgi:hypothetical protein